MNGIRKDKRNSVDAHRERRILVIQNHGDAPGGVFCKTLAQNGAVIQTVYPAEGETPPDSSAGYDGLLVLGGPQNAYDDERSPFFADEMRLMRAFAADGKAVAGICLGCQLLARAYGGVVYPLGELEFGFQTLVLTRAGASDPLLGKTLPRLMEYHQDTFTLPAGATLLVGGCGRPQAFRMGNHAYGFQFHLEVDEATAREWIMDLQNGGGGVYAQYQKQFSPQFMENTLSELPRLTRESAAFCARVAKNWLLLESQDKL
jgi:GMP synthase-like glutamine amidotransferase